jgi:hypothetical protein
MRIMMSNARCTNPIRQIASRRQVTLTTQISTSDIGRASLVNIIGPVCEMFLKGPIQWVLGITLGRPQRQYEIISLLSKNLNH